MQSDSLSETQMAILSWLRRRYNLHYSITILNPVVIVDLISLRKHVIISISNDTISLNKQRYIHDRYNFSHDISDPQLFEKLASDLTIAFAHCKIVKSTFQ